MKKKHLAVSVFALMVFSHLSIVCAQKTQESFDPLLEDITNKLPSLEALIDSALQNSPYLAFEESQIKIDQYDLKSTKRIWSEHLGVNTDVRYGSFDNLSEDISQGQTSSYFTTRTETKYSFGVYLRYPLYDILNRNNEIKIKKMEIQQSEHKRNMKVKDIRMLVISAFNQLILSQNLLKIKAEYRQTSLMQIQMAENKFMNGEIPLTEYARISEIHSRALSGFEEAKISLIQAYMNLEELVGIKLNKLIVE